MGRSRSRTPSSKRVITAYAKAALASDAADITVSTVSGAPAALRTP